MEKTITLNDLQHYLQEINRIEKRSAGMRPHVKGPSDITIQHIMRYSSALNILKTKVAGTVYNLAN